MKVDVKDSDAVPEELIYEKSSWFSRYLLGFARKDNLPPSDMKTIKTESLLLYLVIVMMMASSFGCQTETKTKQLLSSAEQNFASGDYEAAEIKYKNLVGLDPANPLVFHRLGTIYLERGDALRAAQFLNRAKSLAPDDPNIRVSFAEAILSLGAAKEARKELKSVLDQNRSEGKALILMAELANTEEERAETLRYIQRAEKGAEVAVATAIVALRKGDLPIAQAELDQALSQNSQYSSALILKAVMEWQRKDLAAADASFKAAIRNSAIRSSERLKYAEFLCKTDQAASATTFLGETVQQAPDFLPGWRMLARIAIEGKNYDEAQKKIDKILVQNASDFEAHQLMAQLAMAKGDPATALKALEELKGKMPPHPGLELQLAKAHIATGDSNLAIEALNRVISMDPKQTEAVFMLVKLNLARGESEKAISLLQDFLNAHPGESRAQMLLAEAYRSRKRPEAAVEILKARIQEGRAGSEEHVSMGMALRDQNKLEEARREFENALELAPGSFQASTQLIALDLRKENYRAAHERVAELLDKNPNSAGIRCLQATVFEKEKRWEEAEATLKEAVKQQPDFLSSYGLLIRLYTENGKIDEAAAQLQKFLEQEPQNVSALMKLGAIHQQKGNFEEARQCYQRILAQKADFAPALNNLAAMEMETSGDLGNAFDLAKKARLTLPNDGFVADTLGWIHFQRGEYRNSFPLLREAAGELVNDPSVQYHYGMAAYMMNEPDLSRSSLQRALAIGTPFGAREDAQQRVSFLSRLRELKAEELRDRLARDPKDYIACMRLAEILEENGNTEEAVALFIRASNLNPEVAAPFLRAAILYSGSLENWTKAAELAGKARELTPDDPRSCALLGKATFEMGNHELAYRLLKENVSRAGVEPRVLVDCAWAAYSVGQVEEARRYMNQSLKGLDGAKELLQAKRFLDVTTLDGRSRASLDMIDPLLKEQPAYVPALMVKAAALETSSQEEAATVYESVLKLYPHFVPAQKCLARIYVDRDDKLAMADSLARKARETMMDDSELTGILAKIRYRQSDFAEARRLLESASTQRNLGAEEAYVLGMSLGELGRKDEARQWLERAVNGGLKEANVAKARAMLSRIQ